MSARVAAVLLVVALAAMLAHVWVRVKLIEVTQRRERLNAHVDSLESANAMLRAQVARLGSPDRVTDLATSKLGLSFAPSETEVRALRLVAPASDRVDVR